MRRQALVVCAALATAAGCADDGPRRADPAVLVVTEVADGFSGPTQLTSVDGDLVVAELNGGERDGTGRILRFDPAAPDDREVLVEGLLAPTGVAVDGDRLWIMERRRLSVGPLADPTDRTIVADDLPFNGRSEGTLTAVDGGGILYDTSGARDGDRLEAGSGILWFLAGPDAEPDVVATGFKHAYAHAPLGDGRWLVTEISDGTFGGRVPPDELVVVADGDDFAYPRCVGDGEPVVELGATSADCADTPPSLALFEPRSTPTSVAIAPWDPQTALVALWVTGEIVAVPLALGDVPHEPIPVVTGLERPQHLAVVGDRILATDHASGRIVAVEPAGGRT